MDRVTSPFPGAIHHGPEEINFIEVKVKAHSSVLTTFPPAETAWNAPDEWMHAGLCAPCDRHLWTSLRVVGAKQQTNKQAKSFETCKTTAEM